LRFCYPDATVKDVTILANTSALKVQLRETGFGKLLLSIAYAWATFLVIIIFGIALSIGFLWLLANFARCMTYTAIGLVLTLLLGGGAILLIMGLTSKKPDAGGNVGAGIGCIIVGLFVVLQVWCYRKSLEVAIAVIDATADFFIATKRIIAVGLMYFMITMFVIFCFVASEMALLGLHDFKKGFGPQDKVTMFNTSTLVLNLFIACCYVWIITFIDHISKYICMVSACTYYFDSNAERDG